jgi:hypothetical protein
VAIDDLLPLSVNNSKVVEVKALFERTTQGKTLTVLNASSNFIRNDKRRSMMRLQLSFFMPSLVFCYSFMCSLVKPEL